MKRIALALLLLVSLGSLVALALIMSLGTGY